VQEPGRPDRDTKGQSPEEEKVRTTHKTNFLRWGFIFFTFLLWARLSLLLVPFTQNLIGACLLGGILATCIGWWISTLWKRHCEKAALLRRLYEVCR
jgi:hypothetical protein